MNDIEARTYRCATPCVMARADLAQYLARWKLPDETEMRLGNPIPVFGLDNAPIGFGYSCWVDDQLGMDLDLDYHTQERLLIDQGDNLYIRFALVRQDPPDAPMFLTLDHVVVSTSQPAGGAPIRPVPREDP